MIDVTGRRCSKKCCRWKDAKTVDGVKPPALPQIADDPQQVPVPNSKATHYSTADVTSYTLHLESKPRLDSRFSSCAAAFSGGAKQIAATHANFTDIHA